MVKPKGKLYEGGKVTADMVRAMPPEEPTKVKTLGVFEEMSLSENFPEFLTLPLYEAME